MVAGRADWRGDERQLRLAASTPPDKSSQRQEVDVDQATRSHDHSSEWPAHLSSGAFCVSNPDSCNTNKPANNQLIGSPARHQSSSAGKRGRRRHADSRDRSADDGTSARQTGEPRQIEDAFAASDNEQAEEEGEDERGEQRLEQESGAKTPFKHANNATSEQYSQLR